LRLEFVANTDSSVYGGLPAIEGLRQQFGLWKKLCAVPGLHPRVPSAAEPQPKYFYRRKRRKQRSGKTLPKMQSFRT
jgi:hypothetical protein